MNKLREALEGVQFEDMGDLSPLNAAYVAKEIMLGVFDAALTAEAPAPDIAIPMSEQKQSVIQSDDAKAIKCAQQILGVPDSALLTSANCKQCGGCRHAYWFGHPEMKNLARAFLAHRTQAATGTADTEGLVWALGMMLIQFDAVLQLEDVDWDRYKDENRHWVAQCRKIYAEAVTSLPVAPKGINPEKEDKR